MYINEDDPEVIFLQYIGLNGEKEDRNRYKGSCGSGNTLNQMCREK